MSNIHQPRSPRHIVEPGRAQTAADFETPEWNEIRYIADEYAGNVRYWQPGAKKKSFENGETFAYRILPEVAPANNTELFLPTRQSDGTLSARAIWPINVIDKFGFDHKVSFIPTLPFVPTIGKYEPYSGPYDNPYRLLTGFLWSRRKRLPKEWLPLVMTTDEITEYRKQNGLWNTFFSTLLLPLPKFRYFSYALVYRGYDVKAERDFEFDGEPFGVGMNDGLQIVSINQQAYDDLKREYARRARTASTGTIDEFYFPDPADASQGTINYVRNRSYPNPVDSSAGKSEGFGYAGAVECRYHYSATKFREVDLRLNAEFLDRYYENWQPWSQMLQSTIGAEQVRLIARIAPELKSPCEQAWDRHPVLMDAWEEAFAVAPDDYDFHETLHTVYGTNESDSVVAGETNVHRSRPSIPPSVNHGETSTSSESVREEAHPQRQATPPTDISEPPLDAMLPSPRSRTLSAIDVPETSRLSVPAVLRSRQVPHSTVSPLQVIGERSRRGLLAGATEFEELEPEFPPPSDDVPF
jgi:hypothetical protein